MRKSKKYICFLLIISLNVSATNVPDFSKVKGDSPFVSEDVLDSGNNPYAEVEDDSTDYVFTDQNQKAKENLNIHHKKESPFVLDSIKSDYKDQKISNRTRSFDNTLPGSGNLHGDGYLEYKFKDLYKSRAQSANANLSFTYFKDGYDYKDNSRVYDKTFKNNLAGTYNTGLLIISSHRYFSKDIFSFGHGVNFGVGFQNGVGKFSSDGSSSTAKFHLWTLPIDYALGIEMDLGTTFSFALSGGPSAMILMQNRSDFLDGEKGKRVNQFGYGFSGMGSLRFNLFDIFPRSSYNLYRNHSITKYHMTLSARYQNYDHFQDKITISGLSFGVGLLFEYL